MMTLKTKKIIIIFFFNIKSIKIKTFFFLCKLVVTITELNKLKNRIFLFSFYIYSIYKIYMDKYKTNIKNIFVYFSFYFIIFFNLILFNKIKIN